MKYSIIIPIYNSEKSLEVCLDSVANQTYTDFEVLMVNDGSTDRSEEICLEFVEKDKRFRYLPKRNGGVSSARNFGLDHAKGTYITFLDSDDRYFSTYLSSFEELLKKYPSAGHYWCGYKQLSDYEDTNSTIFCYSKKETVSVLHRDCIMDLHVAVLDGGPWNKLYRRDLLHKIRMDEEISLGEDMLFNFLYLDLNPNTEIVVNNIPQYGYYVVSNQSLDHKYRANMLEIAEVLIGAMEDYLSEWSVSADQWTKFYTSSFYFYERVLRNTYRPENPMTSKEKRIFNNQILRSEEFQRFFVRRNCWVHPLLEVAYRTKDYRAVLLFEKLVKLKSNLFRK